MGMHGSKFSFLAALVLIGFLVAGCVSGGSQATTATPAPTVEIGGVTPIPEEDLELPNLEEETGLNGEGLGG